MKVHSRNFALGMIFLLVLVVYMYIAASPAISWGASNNYKNVSVRTTVNITQGSPEILNVTCNNGTTITLNAGTTKTVSCIVTIQDYNGGSDINNTNMTFYYYLNQSTDPNDNNTHYTNQTCTGGTPNGYLVNWTCSVDLLYYAINGSWRANLTVRDQYNLTSTAMRNATISALYALNLTDVVDYGNLAVGDTSGAVQANITNLGNQNINVSVYAFGGNNETAGASYAMICAVRNLTLPNERYDINSATAYASMTPVTGSAVVISGLTVQKQTIASAYVINSTYWRLHVNLSANPFGQCNGTLFFNAEAP
jgi:hypothetical protein